MHGGLPRRAQVRPVVSFLIQLLEINNLRLLEVGDTCPLKKHFLCFSPTLWCRRRSPKVGRIHLGSSSIMNNLGRPSGFCCLLQSERKWDLLLVVECLLEAKPPAEKSGGVVGPIWMKQGVTQNHKSRLLLFYYLNWTVSTFHRWLGSARELGSSVSCYCKMLS